MTLLAMLMVRCSQSLTFFIASPKQNVMDEHRTNSKTAVYNSLNSFCSRPCFLSIHRKYIPCRDVSGPRLCWLPTSGPERLLIPKDLPVSTIATGHLGQQEGQLLCIELVTQDHQLLHWLLLVPLRSCVSCGSWIIVMIERIDSPLKCNGWIAFWNGYTFYFDTESCHFERVYGIWKKCEFWEIRKCVLINGCEFCI